MSVQTQSFRVVGVNTHSGEDVSVVIDAATKAAAEVKAEKMHIETTHIVRLKQDTPQPPDEYELFSAEAAEALAGQRTINLVEECVSQEESRPTPAEVAASAEPHPHGSNPESPAAVQPAVEPEQVLTTIARPSYAGTSNPKENQADQVSGLRAFALVFVVLLGMSAGAYFVLVHQPNTTVAQDEGLVFGEDLFSDVLEPSPAGQATDAVRDAFNSRAASTSAAPSGPPIAVDQQLRIVPPAEDALAIGLANPPKLKLQSVVTTNKGRFAVINGKLYEQGGDIGTAKLVSVADDWVLIEREDKQFTLQIQTKTTP